MADEILDPLKANAYDPHQAGNTYLAGVTSLMVSAGAAATPLTAERVLTNKFSIYPVIGEDVDFLCAGERVDIPASGLHFEDTSRHFDLSSFTVQRGNAAPSDQKVSVVYRPTGKQP